MLHGHPGVTLSFNSKPSGNDFKLQVKTAQINFKREASVHWMA
jgi:hypothetical protein